MGNPFLYTEAIKNIMQEQKCYSPKELIDQSVDYFYKKLVSKNDQLLFDVAFNQRLTQQELDDFLNNWDIECAGSAKALMLSYTMRLFPDLKWNNYTGPRLQGVFNFYRFRNLELIAHYKRIGKALNDAGIFPMIFKGGAMRYLRPDLPRTMGDIDILVRTDSEYNQAKEIIRTLGYDYKDNEHSIDLFVPGKEDVGVLDIHQYLEIGVEYDTELLKKKLFERAKRCSAFNVDTFLPCFEDLVFISLTNMVKNIRESTSVHGILYTLFDLKYLTSLPDFNWDIVKEDVLLTQIEPQMYMAICFVNKVVPAILSETLIEDEKFKKNIVKWYNHDVFYTFYVDDVKRECKKLRLKNAFKSWKDFKHYFRIEGQHFFTKRIIKHPILVALFLKICHKSN